VETYASPPQTGKRCPRTTLDGERLRLEAGQSVIAHDVDSRGVDRDLTVEELSG
jgi:hypothetical protein